MRTTTSIGPLLAQEHAAIGLVLDGMDRAIEVLEHGWRVDPGLLRDLRDYFRLFVERCHEGKEEQLLFPTLRLFPEMAGLVAELEQEHLRGAALLDAYAAAVDDYARHGLIDAALGVLGPHGAIDGFYTAGPTPQERVRLGPPPQGHGLLGVLLTEGSALRLADIARDPRSVGFPTGHPIMRSLLGVPIAHGGQVVGNLYLADKVDAEAFSPEDERL